MNDHPVLSVYGRLTSNPRIIETRTGKAMTVGRLAVALPCRENGENGEATLWAGIVAWGELAESLAKHVKVDMVSASGRLKITRYTNRDGEAKEELEILADGLVSARTTTVRVRRGTLPDEVAVPARLLKQETKLRAAVREGPVIMHWTLEEKRLCS